jgi:hypothetical protein
MSQRSATATRRSPDLDVEQVLDALRKLIERAQSPVVRECLIDARQDIAFLATPDGKLSDEADGSPEDLAQADAA